MQQLIITADTRCALVLELTAVSAGKSRVTDKRLPWHKPQMQQLIIALDCV
jgi:hypothetical protein